MSTVSTAASLLSAMQFENAVYSSVIGHDQNREEETGTSLWNIPGLGVIGLGAATVAVVMAYKSIDGIKEALSSITDMFGDETPEDRISQLGAAGEGLSTGDVPDGEPRIAKEKKIDIGKKETPGRMAAPSTQVNRIDNLPGTGVYADSGLARPTAEIRNILQNTAKSEGTDFGTLYALAGAESSFRAGAKAGKSTATGLFQFTSSTWDYMVNKVYPELGYKPSDRLDPEKSSIVASRYIASIRKSLTKKLGHAPTIGQTYLGYFMGPTGASKFLTALDANPSAKGSEVFKSAADANPNLFYHNGDKTKPLTLRETMNRLEGKINKYYADSGSGQTMSVAAMAPPPAIGDTPSAKPLPVSAKGIRVAAAQAKPEPVSVQAPDFTAVAGGGKGEAREDGATEVAQAGTNTKNTSSSHRPIAMASSSKSNEELSYIRDKSGRLVAIRG